MMFAFMLQAGEGIDSDHSGHMYGGKIAELNGSEEAIDVTSISTVLLEDEEVIEADNMVKQCLEKGLDNCP